MDVILNEENLSKAIGRRGQNVRLATKLINYEINIMTDQEESEKRQEEFKDRTESLMKNLDIYDRKDHLPWKLSGGEKQRLAIARALYNDPKVLIFDEPSIALDQISKELFIKVLKKVQPNKMVLIISHDSEIIKHCDNLISLKQGILSNIDQKTKQMAIDKDQLVGLI